MGQGGYLGFLAIITLFTIFVYRWILGRLAVKSKSEKGGALKEKSTFRVTGIPADWDHQQLQLFLNTQGGFTDAAIESLASRDHGGSQVATVTFGNAPIQHGRSWSTPILNESNNRKHIVALSGLGGHAFRSFKERGGSHMWLRDSLPFDLTLETSDQLIARVMIYGYDSTIAGSKSMQNIEDLATKFNAGLQKPANASIIRPIILIGHSLGGLIIKQALISLSKSENEDDQNLIRAIYGVVFFGTPHDGMDITSLIHTAGDSSPNRFLLESLGRNNSQILTVQQREFHRALGDKGNSEVFCFYETLESPTAQLDKAGNWKMNGPATVLVTKSSATHCRPWEDGAEHICAINRTHSKMVKFGPHDSDYNNIREKLKGLSRRAFSSRGRLQTSRSIFLVPYSQNPSFVTRPEPLSNIKRQSDLDQQEESIKSRRIALYGLGGVGKTQIAIAYAYWLQKTYPDISVFWVHASNADRFRQSYALIAMKCNIPGHDDPKANILLLVSSWLKLQTKMQWLMVIDNADDMDLFFGNQLKRGTPGGDGQITTALTNNDLALYIPDCNHGSVLITTRDKKAGIRLCQGFPPIEINKMSDDEAYKLVQVIVRNQDISREEASPLFSKLEHLSLALAQAASFIQENGISIDEYIQILDESDSAFIGQLSESFETVGRDSETPYAVTATWIVSFEQIRRKEMLASDILSFLSFFHFQAIPKTFVEYYFQRRDPEQTNGGASASAVLIKALGTLKAFCFISEGEDKSLTMHRLVQLVTQKWVVSEGHMAKYVNSAMRVMAVNYPYGDFETREICLRYLPHANAVLEKNKMALNNDTDRPTTLLLFKMARYFWLKGQWKKGGDLQVQAAEIQKRASGENHPRTLVYMDGVVMAYRRLGRLQAAKDLQVQILKLSKAVLGKEDPETLKRMGSLAEYIINKKKFREDDEITLILMDDLAQTYIRPSRLTEAEKLETQILKIRKKVEGGEHPYAWGSMSIMATIYQKQGRWKEAEDLQVQVIEAWRRELGEEHPDTLANLINLIETYREQGRWREAEDLAVRVLEISKSVLGAEHLTTVICMLSLSAIYLNQFRWKEAENLGEQVMEMRKRILAEGLGTQLIEIEKRVLGEDHLITLISLSNLVMVYRAQSRWKEAEELGIRVLEALKKKLGEEHPEVLGSMNDLSMEVLGERLMELSKKVFGEGHHTVFQYSATFADTLKGLSRTSEAMALLTDSVAGLEKTLGRDHPDTADKTSVLEQWQKSVQVSSG
ncbi:hypothetical protein GGI43DRAFT_426058 [Trichoderma evansii]